MSHLSSPGISRPQRNTPLGQVAEIFPGPATRPTADGGHQAGIRIIGLSDLVDGHVQPAYVPGTVSDFPPETLARHALRSGDVLLAARGSQPKVAWVVEADLPAVASANLLVVRARPEVLPGVLFAFLASEAGIAMTRALSRSATDQLSITARDLATLELPVPLLATQVVIHELIEASERAYSAAIEAAAGRRDAARAIVLDMLRQSAND